MHEDSSRFRAGTVAIVLSLTAGNFGAADPPVPPLITDRPDQTESSDTVPAGYLQLEVGWTHTEDDEDTRVIKDSFPETLVRLGLADRFELRLGFDGYIWQDTDQAGAKGSTHDGNGDTEIGFKYKLFEEEGMQPQGAVLCGLALPTGESPFSSERADPSVRLAFSHTLSDRLSLGYNAAVIWASEDDAGGERDTTASWVYSAVLGIELSERLGTFIEYFSEIPTGSGEGPANSFDAGFTYLAKDNLQFDVLGGVGLSDQADDWFVGAGFVYRTR